jgi:hypothetical protein
MQGPFALDKVSRRSLERIIIPSIILPAVRRKMTTPTSGFDAAQSKHEDDDLDRWRFASEIVDVILTTPPDWSARIGIFGKWGEGKSTVLRFAEGMLREKSNVVFWFNPWSVGNWQDLWDDFGFALSEALSSAGIQSGEWLKKWAKQKTNWLESTGISQVAEAAAGLVGKDKLYGSAFRLVSGWLRYDGPQIRAIREKLGDKRIVVLIDDLDRCAPDLLPRLLMSLRGILDLPGFTFLLAFDEEIVARALTDANPAWLEGSNFLEKILDFRYYLPAITLKQKERFLNVAMKKYCPFVPQESTGKVLDLLPDNPRKLKSLIRSLTSLRLQVARHDPDELNWVDMWLAQMLRHESYPFVDLLLEGKALEEVAGYLYSLKRKLSERDKHDKQDDPNEQLKSLFEQGNIKDPLLVKRLTRLIEACRSRSSQHFRYMCELAIRPQALTWKEFRVIRAIWESDPKPSVLANAIAEHVVDMAMSPENVEAELFEALRGVTCPLLSFT